MRPTTTSVSVSERERESEGVSERVSASDHQFTPSHSLSSLYFGKTHFTSFFTTLVKIFIIFVVVKKPGCLKGIIFPLFCICNEQGKMKENAKKYSGLISTEFYV